MPKPIIVGYDPDSCERAPVEFGVAAARFTGAPLTVACVFDSSGHSDEQLRTDARNQISELQAELEPEGMAILFREIDSTKAVRALHELAEADGGVMLVVGSSHRHGAGRLRPGSTAERLMHGAPCPVAVVPDGWTRGRGLSTIGVAWHDDPEANQALHAAWTLARAWNAKLRVLTAVKPRLGMSLDEQPTIGAQRGTSFDDVEGGHLAVAEQAGQAAVAELGTGVATEVEAFAEDPASVLVRVSEHLDLLVCGSRGYGPLKAVMLGSVSRRLASEAHCPVLVLPRGAAVPLEDLIPSGGAAATG